MVLCLNENLFFRKAKARLQTYRRKPLLPETKTLGVYAGVPVLARIPSRLTEAADFATVPEVYFEPNGEKSDPFYTGAKTAVNLAKGSVAHAGAGELGGLRQGWGWFPAAPVWLWKV